MKIVINDSSDTNYDN